MISPADLVKRVGVCGRVLVFAKAVALYFAVGAAGAVGAAPHALQVATKCAPILCLLALVLLHNYNTTEQKRYGRLIALGLALSCAGDAVLVWAGGAALAGGLALFGAAQAAYVRALGWAPARARLGACCAAAGALAAALLPAPGPLRALVAAYALLVGALAWRALARGGPAAPGALLFALSDSMLGYSLFVGPLPYKQVLVMSTYYLAQLCIAMSALRGGAGAVAGAAAAGAVAAR